MIEVAASDSMYIHSREISLKSRWYYGKVEYLQLHILLQNVCYLAGRSLTHYIGNNYS